MSNSDLRENSEAVLAHIGIVQSIIQRVAQNSASCKSLCITLVSAILVLVADKGKPNYTLIAIIPTSLFLFLDAYYLALEKKFRESYNLFIEKLHKESLKAEDLFVVLHNKTIFKTFWKSLMSFSIWPFYLTLFAMILIMRKFVLKV